MFRTFIKTLITFLLILFPFWGGLLISRYTPYTEGNSITNYIIAYCIVTLVAGSLLFYITFRFKGAFLQPTLPGKILFFIGIVMLGIAGLVAAPDLSIKMLEHPEREHFRYIILYIGALLFGFYFIKLLFSNALNLKGFSKWIMITLFSISILELLWELQHHYFYPEALKAWVDNGNKADAFSKNYDNDTVGSIGAVGRLALYTLIIWLSVGLYKVRSVNLWNPIVTSFLCIMGIISSILMFLYFSFSISAPKQFDFLILFFIPGVPFLILYWIGTALLTRKLLSNRKVRAEYLQHN